MSKIFPQSFKNPVFLGVLFIGFLAGLSYLGDQAGMSFIQRIPAGFLTGVQLFVLIGWTLFYLSVVSFLVAGYTGLNEVFSPKGYKEFFRWGGFSFLFIGALLWYPVIIIAMLIFVVLLYLGMGTASAPLFIGDFSAMMVHSWLYALSVCAVIILAIKGWMMPLVGTILWCVSFGFFLVSNED